MHTNPQHPKPARIDVAIVGGGPAGLQAALVLARTRKHVVVFDAPTPPRNAASHGVHNFVGLDDLLPQQIRDQAWDQIDRYDSAELVEDAVTHIGRATPGDDDLIVDTPNASWQAKHVILTCGYRNTYPQLDGSDECWADTIILCPFCDGWENRDRTWGIVPSMPHALDVFPHMVQNWTADRVVIAPRHLDVSESQRALLDHLGVPLYVGDIVGLTHVDGKLTSVELDGGEVVPVETLLMDPDEQPTELVDDLANTLGLELDENGYVAVDEMHRTNVPGLWAAGDVQGLMGALDAAGAGGMAAFMIVHGWFADERVAS